MLLTLTYRGPLPARQKGVSPLKQQLRSTFHPQLKSQLERVFARDRGREVITTVDGYEFLAPAHPFYGTAVDLDVLLLAPDLRAADSDNRLKTLIDGLTRPANSQQLQAHRGPDDGGPTHCLLDNDNLVRRISLDARRWHENAHGTESLVVVSATIVMSEHVGPNSKVPPLLLLF